MDIDFHTLVDIISNDVSIDVGNQAVSGNRQLMNQFEVVFLTSWKDFYSPEADSTNTDSFGGNFLGISGSMNTGNPQSVMSSIKVAVDNTVASIRAEQENMDLDKTELLQNAEIESLDIVKGMVFCKIRVTPQQVQSAEELILDLPVIKMKERNSV